MNRYLSEYIRTLSDRRVQSVNTILKENTLGFNGLRRLVSQSRLKHTDIPGRPTVVAPGEIVDGIKIGEDFSRAFITTNDFEALCDETSLMLNSTKELHDTRIEDITKELNSLGRLIRDFAFLYSGDPGFNWSWGDSFNDESRKEAEVKFIDRDGNVITEVVQLNAAEGTLTLGEKFEEGLVPAIVIPQESNALESLEGYEGDLDIADDEGRIRADFYSQERINQPLKDSGEPGAQMLIKYTLDTAATINCITISNHSEHTLEVLGIWTYTEDGGEEKVSCEVIPDEPPAILGKKALYIPASPAKSVQILFNQRHYRLEKHVPTIGPPPTEEDVKDPNPPGKNEDDKGAPVWMYINLDSFEEYSPETPGSATSSWYENALFAAFREYGPNTAVAQALQEKEEELSYHYSFYVDNIQLNLDTSVSGKAVYISKGISTEKDITVISLQAEEEHPFDLTEGREDSRATSVEYYISNDDGNSWLDIYSSSHTYIRGERIFPDNKGFAETRFPLMIDPTSKDVEFTLFCNGKEVPQRYYGIEVRENEGTGANIGAQIYSPANKYTADYTPTPDPALNLKELGEDRPLFAGGAGSVLRVAIVLRSNGERPSSPIVHYVQIKGKARTIGGENE